ncbi:late competence development ComFB family protein [Clostridium sp. MD294]|uniref:late competence development ComFB family protein n=1 Tax=Clostridium sp. MD294 TaxID=97138 RepID=UPI0002CC2AEC|nr:late competence development ComFB family protein [Clostridium sp. MD294]NDO46416.1 hypothetical protein [Clostridium sp. MD294]USF29154.1 hypothetical protein C820_000537 [Clostridium sp. MD294]
MSAQKNNKTPNTTDFTANNQNIEEENIATQPFSKSLDFTPSMEIQKSDDTSHVSEIIKEKLTELLEPTEIITETVTPPDTFIPFTETEENTIHLQHEIEPEEVTPEEAALFEQTDIMQKQTIIKDNFENVIKNDSKQITLNDEEYVYMNVMETFVKEIIVDYMKQYAHCSCNHCIIDTMALALTNLPSKYIVVKKGSLSPLLHMYRTKYSVIISTEVLKACLAVGKSPHHDKK